MNSTYGSSSSRTARILLVGFTLLCLLTGLAFVAASAHAAQPPIPTTTPTENTTVSGERIQSGLVLLESSYNGKGQATLRFRVDSGPIAVTITDAGAFRSGGEIPRRTVVLEEGTHTIEMPVTESESGLVGVTIGTSNVLYAEPIEVQKHIFSRDATWKAVQYGTAGGAVGVIVIALVVVADLRRGGRDKVERKA